MPQKEVHALSSQSELFESFLNCSDWLEKSQLKGHFFLGM